MKRKITYTFEDQLVEVNPNQSDAPVIDLPKSYAKGMTNSQQKFALYET